MAAFVRIKVWPTDTNLLQSSKVYNGGIPHHPLNQRTSVWLGYKQIMLFDELHKLWN
jgi:hypothetical protein